jgi:NADPH2:quinone reductase
MRDIAMPRHVICRELGEPEALHLEAFDSKPLAAGQVRVAVRAAGLNYVDVLTIAGKYQHKPPLPFVPGTEAAGDVTEVAPDVTDFAVGDRVMLRGGYTEEVVAPVRDLKRMPSTFDYAQGATFLAGHGTAYYGLIDRAQIKPGETLLVHGAAGGVGLAAVELGKAYGATVIAVASSAEKQAIAKARGADHVLTSGEPFRDKVKELTDGRGADVVFDPVGGKVFEESVRCINWGARLIIVGFLQGVGLAQTNLVLIKNASVLGIRAGEAVRRNPALGPPRQRDLMRLAEEGRISPNISHRLPLEKWVEAMRLLIDRKAIGRVALVME